MLTPKRPSTPSMRPSTPSTPQTGTWKHPRFEEIARRQNASTFTERNVRQILYNLGGLFGMWLLEQIIRTNIPSLYLVFSPLRPFSSYIYLAARVILIYNILVALLPLIRPKDNLDDIPLTPAQRKLLGLPASDAPPTPGSQYVTPPRYARTPTSKSGSPSSPFSNTPLSGKGSPIQGSGRGSTFSPNASPLLHKAMAGGLGNTRRGSYGSPSPLGPGVPKPWFDGPTSPSPSSGKGTSVGLNSKWLYEKGRGSPGNSSLFS